MSKIYRNGKEIEMENWNDAKPMDVFDHTADGYKYVEVVVEDGNRCPIKVYFESDHNSISYYSGGGTPEEVEVFAEALKLAAKIARDGGVKIGEAK